MYDREVDGRVLTFGVSGKLWRNALVMYDRETDSLWGHVPGESIRGLLKGKELNMLASVPRTTWKKWRSLYPGTLVLSVKGREDLRKDAYGSYHKSDDPGMFPPENEDRRLDVKEKVVGVRIGKAARAYPFRLFERSPILQDELAGRPIVLYLDKASETSAIWARKVHRQTLTFSSQKDRSHARDKETGTLWHLLTGHAEAGKLKGTRLEAVPHVTAYWFAWQDFFPHTGVHGAPRRR